MITEHHEIQERRVHTRRIVGKLLEERQEMLVLYSRLADMKPYSDKTPARQLLQEFCQVLVDYTAAWHFEIYQRIAEGKERRGAVKLLAHQLYPHIALTTQAILDFNEKYEDLGVFPVPQELVRDLSWLGEHLAKRIDLEDRIVATLYT